MAQQTYDTFWQNRFARHLEAEMEREANIICTGNVIDHADYKYRVGVIKGLQNAIDAIDEVNTEIKKMEEKKK
jgi:hypothetical protein